MRKNSRLPLRKTASDLAIDRAVQRVYETYGSDLTRFFTDLKKQHTHHDVSEVRKDHAAEKKRA